MATSPNCPRHPTNPVAGLCMQCRQAYCEACLVKVNGINTCSVCLEKKVVAAEKKDKESPWFSGLTSILATGLGAGLLWLLLLSLLSVFHGLLRA